MEIDEIDRNKVRRSLEQELGRKVSEEEVATSYRRINLYLQSIDLDRPRPRRWMSGYDIITSWFRS